MPTLTYPGVYIEELPSGVQTITGVATSIAAFVGWAPQGPVAAATLVQSWQDFASQFGGLDSRSLLSYSVNQFFANGGQAAELDEIVQNCGETTSPVIEMLISCEHDPAKKIPEPKTIFTLTGIPISTPGNITSIYAARMSGVFMISLSTIWVRTRLMPRWLVFLTYALALGLLLTISSSLWVTLIFPAWVCVVSIYVLAANLRGGSLEGSIKMLKHKIFLATLP